MAIQISPGVNVSEVDLTAGVQAASLSSAAFAGLFGWGPALDVVTVTSESDLVKVFGKPDTNNYKHWFTAQSFLAYSNQLRVVRALSADAFNATTDKYQLAGTVTVDGGNLDTVTGIGTNFLDELKPGQLISIAGVLREINTIDDVAEELTVTKPFDAEITENTVFYAYGTRVPNEAAYETDFAEGNTSFGLAAAKWSGELGNSLRISLCPSEDAFKNPSPVGDIGIDDDGIVTGTETTFDLFINPGDTLVVGGSVFTIDTVTSNTSATVANPPTSQINATSGNWYTKWAYADYFPSAPGTSAYASNFGGSNDEMHIVVVDEDGAFTGTRGAVLEKYAFVSKASDAKDASGNANYYKTVLNRQSAYVWWMNHVTDSPENWGELASAGEFGADTFNYYASFDGGNDSNEHATDADIIAGWDLFADVDAQDVSILVTGPSTLNESTEEATPAVALHVINNIAGVRKDCVAFVSPFAKSVIGNAGDESEDVIADRDALPSTSYAVMDSGWKYTYDKYNDVYRWIPLNGDVAGLAVRTDTTNDPWFSPAGFTRGNIKNVVKLAWNPKQAYRDDLYNRGVNPVVSFPGQGVLLYGDKTLLSRPSAFDRINVRRLFIALEKTIARYAKSQLFEFNDEFTRAAFRSAVEPYLRDVKARRGITDYLVVCDSTNNTGQVIDANQFVGDIYVKPTRSINFIQLNFVAVRSGVSFQEVIGTV